MQSSNLKSYGARKSCRTLALAFCLMGLGSTGAHAQTSPLANLVQALSIAKKMNAVCNDRALTNMFALQIMGHEDRRTATDNETDETEALASELSQGTAIQVKSARWTGNATGGSCHLDMVVTLPSLYVTQLGSQIILQGDMWFNLEPRGTSWTLISITDQQGSGLNSFRTYLKPYTAAMVQDRLNQRKQANIAEAREREEQAAEARRVWIRAHPKEYAAMRRQEAVQSARIRSMLIQEEAGNAQKQSACEANGGTWGRRTRDGMPFGPLGCFFQTAN